MKDVTPRSIGETYDVWIAALNHAFRELVETAAALVPNLIGAAVLLLIGWLLACLLRNLLLRLGTGLDRLADSMGLRTGTELERLHWPVSRVVAVTVYWLVILFFIAVAAEVLGLGVLADLFSGLIGYVPTVLLSAAVLFVIVVFSSSVAAWIEREARSAHIAGAAMLAAAARVILIAMASIVALGQIGVDTALLVSVFSLVVAAFLLGAALAFGIGSADAVRNVVAAHHMRGVYRVGQRVRVSGEEGEILELTPTAVFVETVAGRTMIPARMFQDGVSILLDDAGDERD